MSTKCAHGVILNRLAFVRNDQLLELGVKSYTSLQKFRNLEKPIACNCAAAMAARQNPLQLAGRFGALDTTRRLQTFQAMVANVKASKLNFAG